MEYWIHNRRMNIWITWWRTRLKEQTLKNAKSRKTPVYIVVFILDVEILLQSAPVPSSTFWMIYRYKSTTKTASVSPSNPDLSPPWICQSEIQKLSTQKLFFFSFPPLHHPREIKTIILVKKKKWCIVLRGTK